LNPGSLYVLGLFASVPLATFGAKLDNRLTFQDVSAPIFELNRLFTDNLVLWRIFELPPAPIAPRRFKPLNLIRSGMETVRMS
jgi:hypothetical protein